MEKKKKTRFIVVWLLITAAFLAGSLLVDRKSVGRERVF